MFSNIGGKLKIAAKVVFWLGLAVSAGLVVYALCSAAPLIAFLAVLPLVLWIVLGVIIGSLVMYGFGELVDRAVCIDYKLSGQKPEQ